MPSALRKTGIDVVGDIPWGTHFCHFYETKQDLLDTLVPYFKAGLDSKEFCVWVVSTSELITVEGAKRALAEAVPDLDRHLSDGNIEIFSGLDWYLEEGVFNLERVTRAWDAKLKRALARGYDGMRVSGDTFWLREKDWKDFFAYEKQLNESITDQPMTVLCTYPLAKSGAGEVLDVVHAHQFAIARRQGEWEVVETPELIQAKGEIKRLNEELELRVVDRTRELAAANEELRREIAERKGAEDALRRSEDRQRLIIDTVPALIHTGLPDGQLDFFNQRWLTYVGLSLEELSGWKWTAVIHPEDVAAMVERWRAALATGEPYEHEARVRRADGEYRWMVHREVPLRDERGNIAKWYASSIDIEDRKRAEDALRQSENRLRLVLETLPVGVSVTNRAGDIVLVNAASQRIWGGTIAGGRERWEQTKGYWHDSGQTIAPESWASVRALSKGETSLNELIDIETYHGQRKIIRNSAAPVRDSEGLIVGAVIVNEDVTNRVRAEEALNESETKLKQAQQLAHIGYWERDLLADRLTWSEETDHLLGLESYRGVLHQAQLREFIHPDDWQHHQQVLNEALQGSRLFDVEVRFMRPDGNIRFVHIRDEIVRNESGKPIRMFGAVQDITDLKQAEEAVRRSEEHLRLVIDTIPTMAWTAQPDGLVDFINQRWLDYAGLTSDQYFKDPMGAVHPDDVPRVREKWQANMTASKTFEDEMRLRRADGEYRWYLVRAEPLHDEQGTIVKWYGVSTDIEDRKQAEEKLSHSEVQLAQAQRLAHVGSWDWDMRTNKVTWSDELYRIFGLEPGTIMVVGDAVSFIHPDDRDLVFSTVQNAVANKERYSFYYRALRPDGTERIVHSRGAVLTNDHGEPIRVFGATQDVTELKQAEEKLLQSESQLAEAQRLAHIGSWDWDVRTNAVTWSDELYRIFGLQPGTISVAGEVDRFIHPDDLDLGWDTVKRAVASKEPYDYYHRILRPDGTERIARSRGSIMSDERGEPIKVFGATQDVTELKRAEEKLKTTSEQLRALSASLQSAREEEGTRIAREIHDELGSTLTTLRWDLEGFEKTLAVVDNLPQVASLQERIKSMTGLIDTTIKSVRRISSELRPTALDDLGLVAAIEWQARQFEERTGIVCQCYIAAERFDLTEVQATALFRVFQEALTNVLRHAQATMVETAIAKEEGQIVLTISDNGRGITEDETLGPQSLGLLGMRERVYLIGGEIDIVGIGGKGTTITVSVPLSDELA